MPASTQTEPNPARNPRTRGAIAALALLPAIAPLGVAVGVALAELSAPRIITWLSAPLMVAGASQVVLFTQIDDGATIASAAAAVIVLNARFVIYGAALANRFSATQPAWFRTIGPHYIVDQTYAMVRSDISESDSDDVFRRYFMTAGTILWIGWSSAVAVGILLGPVLPPQVPLEFVLPASFVALIAPSITRGSELIALALGAAVALTAPSVALAVAAIGAAAVGATSGRERHG